MSGLATSHRLTRYASGGVKELVHLSIPLMLSSASGALMFFVDRIILARYSAEALDASVATGMPCFLFQFGAIAIASIAEVFVGQFNGAKKFEKLGIPVWQMIWFCLLTTPIFFILAFWGGSILVPLEYRESGKYFFRWLMLFGPMFAMIPALSAFFVGMGKVRIVTTCVIVGNLLNFLLDVLLVFGWKGVIPEMGLEGAALATIIAEGVQVYILFVIFLNKHNRKKYNTAHITFDKKVFLDCLKIGWPNSVGHMLEIGAWTILLHILARAGADYVTVFAVGQGFFVLFSFAIDGMQKGVIAVSSNLIGANQQAKIPMVLKSAFKMHMIFITILMIPTLLYPDVLVREFLFAAHGDHANVNQAIMSATISSLLYLWVYFFFDGMVWVIAGILTAAGRTLFVLFANAFNAWFFAITPLAALWYYGKLELLTSWQVTIFYGMMNICIFSWRYKQGAWKINKILS